nr:extensin-like [Aegilops tauschii subsp. strangulata]
MGPTSPLPSLLAPSTRSRLGQRCPDPIVLDTLAARSAWTSLKPPRRPASSPPHPAPRQSIVPVRHPEPRCHYPTNAGETTSLPSPPVRRHPPRPTRTWTSHIGPRPAPLPCTPLEAAPSAPPHAPWRASLHRCLARCRQLPRPPPLASATSATRCIARPRSPQPRPTRRSRRPLRASPQPHPVRAARPCCAPARGARPRPEPTPPAAPPHRRCCSSLDPSPLPPARHTRTRCSFPLTLSHAEEPPPLSPRPRPPIVCFRPPCYVSAAATLPMLRPVAAAGAPRRCAGARAHQPPHGAQSGVPPRASTRSGCVR